MRIGHGYDSHRLVEGRPLVLGGVEIPYARGLDGWTDADAVTHAVIDALCGAAGLGDIGTLFPPGEDSLRGISSLILLERTVALVRKRGMDIVNLDVTVIAEEPRLAPHIIEMRRRLCGSLGVPVESVSIKAKTNEHMGFAGRGEGIAAFSVVLLSQTHPSQ